MDPQAAARLAARYARRAEPIGLTPEELDFDHFPVTTSMPAIPVWAWIRFPGCAELVKGETSTWSAKAVQVMWEDAGIRRSTWVWASAVSRRSTDAGRSPLVDRTPPGGRPRKE
ncbi:hypothetical protein [Arthrobacter caoxuetaonis]|uniref:Uncharacterized protein n=1 Tax=Arthrobacter caoxuetaonis TaxID=2886935 RepID=A0A9X1MFM4_9MICC|nr:hypothetical protein [Arthrobacter caoxuetaonis]MCC3282631.1 hypothetical protein [Arthrobacter caoxuetaonis]MCC3297769.1 hypothetical protein [Arthrobacter caoxuetaonis]USQ56037.1 hypothetical protein NF551_09615 [Arthrobacter caoxuetaonis]